MHGAAISFARQLTSSGNPYDLILANDMMDVAVFSALIRAAGINTPVVAYFHENQIAYPLSPRDSDTSAGRDLHYGFINYTSALASKRVYFNSHYHRETFLDDLSGFLERFPDNAHPETVHEIAAKAQVLPLGMDLRALDALQPEVRPVKQRPLLLWNHRWEHDKNPDEFLRLLLGLADHGIPFELALLGERGEEPELLEVVRQRLGAAILQDGPVEGFSDYAQWLWRADILPVTSLHDFFGGSVVEAVYCGCHPLLPRRLAYPGHFPGEAVFYDSPADALDQLVRLIESRLWRDPCRLGPPLKRYDWQVLAPRYDEAFASLFG